MQTHTVQSTTIAVITYESAWRQLYVQFRDSSAYMYFDVPVQVYQALLEAPSKGEYFNARIRGKFTYQRSGVPYADR